ncbi:hypothetical protein [Neisseria chenwenguii]|nr:hypothetical protein [Neisseria chenwenguii]
MKELNLYELNRIAGGYSGSSSHFDDAYKRAGRLKLYVVPFRIRPFWM